MHMRTTKESNTRALTVAITAALIGGIGWLAKIVVMIAQGGPDDDSVPEAIAFFLGLLGVMVAAATAGAHRAGGRPLGLRVLAAVGAVVLVGVVVGVGQAALSALPGESWVREEAIFGIVGAVFVLAAAVALHRSPGRGAVDD
jgi:peptidoglycan/LPS O-acetylase OafA/YrhL